MPNLIRPALLIAAASAAIYSTAAGAQFPGDAPAAALVNKLLGAKPRSAPVSTFTVAGVRLGMTPAEARAALSQAGFTPRSDDPKQDAWSAIVSRRAAERVGGKVSDEKVPMFTMATGPQGEHVEVWYTPTEEGAKVSSVKYQMPTNRMERGPFQASAIGKYGRPTVEAPSGGLYCTKGEPDCSYVQSRQLPNLVVETSYSFHEIDMAVGTRYAEDQKARIAAAVEAAAPKNAKASF